ncbi:MAG: alpha/beta hydrolase [Pedobacter sp.]|nr:MAG: alpha/beta hydrolase [Pedobacter sp.]
MKLIASLFPMLLMALLLGNSQPSRLAPQSYPFSVQKTGHGPRSLIFIPGFACSSQVWDDTKANYEDQFTCYTLTMAGFAGLKPQPNPNFAQWEAAIAHYIQQNHLVKPILVGHSMGGGLALAIAADYPELIGKIVVVDALPCLAALTNPTFQAKPINDCSALSQQLSTMTDDQFYQRQKMTMSQLVADTAKQALVLSWSLQSDRKTMAALYCDYMNTDLRQKIKAVSCPSLILLEPAFEPVKPAVEAQYKYLTNTTIRYATKGLHFIMYDDKAWYLRQLQPFITNHQ